MVMPDPFRGCAWADGSPSARSEVASALRRRQRAHGHEGPAAAPDGGQRYWPVLATVLIDLPGSVPSLVLMRVRM